MRLLVFDASIMRWGGWKEIVFCVLFVGLVPNLVQICSVTNTCIAETGQPGTWCGVALARPGPPMSTPYRPTHLGGLFTFLCTLLGYRRQVF